MNLKRMRKLLSGLYEKELWKCANNANGVSLNHIDVYLYFPGQPSQKNEHIPKSKKQPKIVCTPSIKREAFGRCKLLKHDQIVGPLRFSFFIACLI